MDPVRAELAHLGIRSGFGWYVTPSQITMTIVKAPGTVLLGSPETEPGRDSSDEGQWEFTITWSFAISTTEITQEQFLTICPDFEHLYNEFAPDPQCPVNAVSWRNAQRFCRLLSERDGLPESEITVARDSATNLPHEDFLIRTGYRLPTEPEWEAACRAGSVTPRFYGNALNSSVTMRGSLTTPAVVLPMLADCGPTLLGCSTAWETLPSGLRTCTRRTRRSERRSFPAWSPSLDSPFEATNIVRPNGCSAPRIAWGPQPRVLTIRVGSGSRIRFT